MHQSTVVSAHQAMIAVKDLIEMKRASGRPQDIEDIKALERLA